MLAPAVSIPPTTERKRTMRRERHREKRRERGTEKESSSEKRECGERKRQRKKQREREGESTVMAKLTVRGRPKRTTNINAIVRLRFGVSSVCLCGTYVPTSHWQQTDPANPMSEVQEL